MMEHFFAHIRPGSQGEPEAAQTVEAHCRNTADYAAQALEPLSLSASGYLAGLVHDAGKYTTQFQNYLLHGEGGKGSVNHTFAGVRLFLERYHSETLGDFAEVVSELLSLAAGGHHGLFDCVDKEQESGFQHRLTKEGIHYAEAVNNFFHFCASEKELDQWFQKAYAELAPVLEKILSMTDENREAFDDETAFYSGLLARLLLSAVIEGDRRDTAAFMNGAEFPPKRSGEALQQMWGTCLRRVEEKLDTLPQTSPIDRARREISDICRQAAGRPGGVFRLNVPTGGGKTLSSLRYALAHGEAHQKQRVFFVTPLLSILEQNASIIRTYLQDDSLILEHHSNLVHTEENPQKLDTLELLTETWEAPIVITTLVQMLNTLFSGKTTAIRRFHALCNSIIVFDEVQTVPSKMLSLFSLAMNFLAEVCGATVILCSATQPCIEQIQHPLHGPVPDLVPFSPALWSVFDRTKLQTVGKLSLEEIASFALEVLETSDSLLIVCNKKAQAEQLFRQLDGRGLARFQLSAAMCVAHRRDTLDRLQASLAQKGQKTVCISTQVIEAGVDISFAAVIRLSAGMDSVVQAAGRCNRSGEAGPGTLAPVYLVECQNESLARLPDIQKGKAATQALLAEFAQHPEQYQHKLVSDEAIGYYYRTLYQREDEGHHDYCCKGRPSLFSLLACNDSHPDEQPYYFRPAFRLAGTLFQVFEENTEDVIVPYGPGKELIQDLCSARAREDPKYLQARLEDAKPYTVSLYQYQRDRLSAEQGLIPLYGGALGLSGHYHAETGFSLEESELEFLGVY